MSLDITLTRVQETEVYSGNITHNLRNMWIEAGIYDILYNKHGETIGQYAEALETALNDMKSRPDHYQKFNSDNGWGTYSGALRFLEDLVDNAQAWPDAKIEVSR